MKKFSLEVCTKADFLDRKTIDINRVQIKNLIHRNIQKGSVNILIIDSDWKYDSIKRTLKPDVEEFRE